MVLDKLIKEQITVIVLAGGESSRMGKDKALLEINNQTLLHHICAIATKVGVITYVVTPWTERYESLVSSYCYLVKEELVLNAKSNTPIIGFVQALRLVQTKWVLLLACDLPYLSSSQVKQWSKSLTTVLPTEVAFLPRNFKGWEALCGFYRSSCLSSVESYIADGGRSFQGWLRQHSVRELILNDRNCLFNCNTPQDWESIQQC